MNPYLSPTICTGTEVPAKRVIPKITNYSGECLEDKRLVFEKGKQNKLFYWLLQKYNLSQRELGSILGFEKSTIRDYFHERYKIKLSTFQKLILFDKEVESFEKFVIGMLPLNWGKVKGGKKGVAVVRAKYGENHLQMLREKGKFGTPNNPFPDHSKPIIVPQEVNYEIAELAGAYLGDGTLTKYVIRLSGDKRFDKIYFAHLSNIAERNFGINGKIKEIDLTNDLILEFCSIKFTKYFRETFDFKIGDKIRNQSKIPQFVLDDEDLAKSFLRGLIDTDGSVSRRDNYLCIAFSSHNPHLLAQVHALGLKFGYFSYGSNVQTGSNSWGKIMEYFSEVGSSNLRHIIRFEERLKNNQFLYQEETLGYFPKYENTRMPYLISFQKKN